MKHVLFFWSCIAVFCSSAQDVEPSLGTTQSDSTYSQARLIWESSTFKEVLALEVFEMAMIGYQKRADFKRGKIAIVDYSKPSTEKRFYVVDLKTKSLEFHTLVAHGKNSGANRAVRFSNKNQSHQSSLGFFRTAETYYGKHGFSLRLDGLEKGINDNARKRAVVMHGASYVSRSFISQQGRLGRSWGCPALPLAVSKKVINAIAKGTCLFIYANNEAYKKNSQFLK